MIQIENLSISFKEEKVLQNFNLKVQPGEKLAITGESGIGKTTLLNILAGFEPGFQGKVRVNGIELSADTILQIRQLIAWLPQETALEFETVKELLLAPFEFDANKDKRPTREEYTVLLKEFGMNTAILSKRTKDISGGQKQRVLLASCLLLKKSILLIDEPTSALDPRVKRQVVDYVLSQKDLTVIAVTHDKYWSEQSDKIINLGK